MDANEPALVEALCKEMLDGAIDNWRFARTFERLLQRVEASERVRFQNQLRWFHQQTAERLATIGMQLVDLSGTAFDAGAAITPVNLEEFEDHAHLVVDHMLEPVVMNDAGVVRFGKAVLRRA